MFTKEIDLTRIFGLCGILAPVIGLSSIFIAILYLPWFSWTEHYLSDIGGNPGSRYLWSTWGVPSVIFNFGLVAAGVLGICFAFGIKQSKMIDSKLGDLGIAFFFLDAGAVIGVGLFTESTGEWRTFFSTAFFVLLGAGLTLIGIALLKLNEKKLGWFTIALLIFGLCSVPLFMTPKPVGSNAIAEIIPIISISVFSIVLGFKLLRIKPNREEVKDSED
jgi:hypothetical membrane protein